MNKKLLYISVSFLGLASLFSSKANDPQYSAPNKPPEPPKYLTPAPLGAAQFSDLPADLKGRISQDLTNKEIGRLSQTNKQNYQEFNNKNFYDGYGQTKEQRFAQVKEFDLILPRAREKLISYLTRAQKENVLVSVKINLSYPNELSEILSCCTHVRSLDLSDNHIKNDEVIAIANSPYLSNLQSLDLSLNNIGDRGAIAIANSQILSNLQSLNLGRNKIEAEGAIAIANSPHMSNLQSLDLKANLIGVDGAIAIANSPYMSNLQSLDLSLNNIGDRGAIAIANSQILSNLQSLNLERNKIGVDGAIAIANSPHMSNLQSLDLHGTKIEVKEVIAIVNSQNLSKLRFLNVHFSGRRNEEISALSALKAAKPNLEMWS